MKRTRAIRCWLQLRGETHREAGCQPPPEASLTKWGGGDANPKQESGLCRLSSAFTVRCEVQLSKHRAPRTDGPRRQAEPPHPLRQAPPPRPPSRSGEREQRRGNRSAFRPGRGGSCFLRRFCGDPRGSWARRTGSGAARPSPPHPTAAAPPRWGPGASPQPHLFPSRRKAQAAAGPRTPYPPCSRASRAGGAARPTWLPARGHRRGAPRSWALGHGPAEAAAPAPEEG